MRERDPLDGLSLVLRSIDAIRNTSALFVLLGTFAIAGLLVAMAEVSYARAADWWGALQAGAALFVAFYGGNAAGILVMDEARGRATSPPRCAPRWPARTVCCSRWRSCSALMPLGRALFSGCCG